MGLFCPFLCTVVVYCIGSKLCSLGSVVDNSGREQWNSWPEECSLLRCSAGQRRADGLSFYPRVMWSIKPAAVLPWMGRHTPAHLNLSTFILLPSFTDCNSNRFLLITASLAIWPHKYLYTGAFFEWVLSRITGGWQSQYVYNAFLLLLPQKRALISFLGPVGPFCGIGMCERVTCCREWGDLKGFPLSTHILHLSLKLNSRKRGVQRVSSKLTPPYSGQVQWNVCLNTNYVSPGGKNRIYSCGS